MRMRRRLPEIYQRIQWLGTVMYSGRGFHYELYRAYWKVVRFLSRPAEQNAFMQMIDEVVWEGLMSDIAKAERSARTDCARFNKGKI